MLGNGNIDIFWGWRKSIALYPNKRNRVFSITFASQPISGPKTRFLNPQAIAFWEVFGKRRDRGLGMERDRGLGRDAIFFFYRAFQVYKVQWFSPP